jgi:uracil-DNA glycosylase
MDDLLLEIARCPIVDQCLAQPGVNHPCRTIVHSQQVRFVEDFQVPEPWSGDLAKAPILFVSSNPSIGDDYYPRGSWSNTDIQQFFEYRFGGDKGRRAWVENGIRPWMGNGRYGSSVRFWSSVKARTFEILEREAKPGIDYALTEVVHCKSRKEQGVAEALDYCATRYLERVVALSGAKVIVSLGSIAEKAIRSVYEIPLQVNVYGPITLGERVRYISFLPHPNSWKDKTFEKCLSQMELQQLRKVLQDRKSFWPFG